MTEKLFGTNRHYVDNGDFSQRYFYKLRGCAMPLIKAEKKESEQTAEVRPEIKSRRQLTIDATRNKHNQREKRK